jgi:hypothetical protein
MYIDLHPPALVAAEPADTFESVMQSPQNLHSCGERLSSSMYRTN